MSDGSHHSSRSRTLSAEEGSSRGGSQTEGSPLSPVETLGHGTSLGSTLSSPPQTPDRRTPSSSPSPRTRLESNVSDTDAPASDASHHSSRSGTSDAEEGSSSRGSQAAESVSSPAEAPGHKTPLGSTLSSTPHTPGSRAPFSSLSPWTQLGSNIFDIDDPMSDGSHHSSRSRTLSAEEGSSSGGSQAEGSPLSPGQARENSSFLGSPLSSTPHTPGSKTPSSSLSPWTQLGSNIFDIDDPASDGSHHSSRSGTVGAEQGGSSRGSQAEGSPLSPGEASGPSTPLRSSLSSTPHTPGSKTPSSSLSPWTQLGSNIFDIDDPASDGSHHSSRSGTVGAEQGGSGRGSQAEGPLSPEEARENSSALGSPLSSTPHTPGSRTPSSSPSPWTQLGSNIFDIDDSASDGSHHSSRSRTLSAEEGSTSGGSQGEGSPLSPGEARENSSPLGSPLSSAPRTHGSRTPSSSSSPRTQLGSNIFEIDNPASDGSHHSSRPEKMVFEQGSSSGGSQGEGSPLSPGEAPGPSAPLMSPLSSTPHTHGSRTPSSSPSPSTELGSNIFDIDNPASDGSHHSNRFEKMVFEQGSSSGGFQGEGSPLSPGEAPGPSAPLMSPLSSTPHTHGSRTPSSSPSPSTELGSNIFDIDNPASDGSHHSSRPEKMVFEQGSSSGGFQGEGSPLSPGSPLSSTPHTPRSGTPSPSPSPSTQLRSNIFDIEDPAPDGNHRSSGSGTLVAERGSSSRGSQGEGTHWPFVASEFGIVPVGTFERSFVSVLPAHVPCS
ncbi:hypothetical protein Emag_002825 [Eimeria magna]